MPSNSSDPISKVLVPIANPTTAERLLRLGCAFLDNHNSSVIALLVLHGELEKETKDLTDIEPIVEYLREEGYPVELQAHKASSVARGVLDVARDSGADLLILGIKHFAREKVVLGPIVENVLAAAPCDVAIYRPAEKGELSRIVVPVDGSSPTRRAAYLGVLLAEHYHVPLEAVHVQREYRPRAEGLAKIEQSLKDITSVAEVQRTLINARSPVEGVLSQLDKTDMLVVAHSRRSELERWFFGNFAHHAFRQAPCPVLLTALASTNNHSLLRKTINRFSLRLTPAEQDDMMRQAQYLSASNLDYIVLILISAMLASLGLLLNNAAVIIGAMLVAPFMQPCIAYAIGIAAGRYRLASRAFVSLMGGVLLAFVVALICGLLLPNRLPTPQLLARGNPVFLDAWVALGSGAVGAYATARKEIPTALAGVAIAAALMPPLAAFGLQIAAGQITLGLHAGLLFLTNVVCISLAAWGVFAWLGVRPRFKSKVEQRFYWPFAITTMAALCLVVFLISTTNRANQAERVRAGLEDVFPAARIVDVQLEDKKNNRVLQIYVTLSTPETITPGQVQQAEEQLSADLAETVRLEIAVQEVITSPQAE